MRKIFNPKVRTWIYAVSGVVKPALIVYGITDEETWAIWSVLGLGIFDATLAFLHTPETNPAVHEEESI